MIHATSEVKTKKIGEGSVIWQNCVILEKAELGKNCNINYNVFIENDVVVGDNVTVKSGVQLWDGLRIENDVFIGPNVTFTNDLIPRSKKYPLSFATTILKRGCSIGANATILSGIVIGELSLVGAGSVVTKDVPPQTVWYGNPARHKGYITLDGILLDLNFTSKDGTVFDRESLKFLKI